MSLDLRLPNITAADAQGQVLQMKNYLYQMVQQLNYSMQTVQNNAAEAAVKATQTASAALKTDPASTFSDIKALIIKSADIVNAYYDEINRRLEGVYVAQSTFGTYTEKTSQEIDENSTNINQAFTNIQQIQVALDSAVNEMSKIENIMVSVNAYINSGLLYTDEEGVPVYGIEVGQRTEVDGKEVFDKYARFTSNKLSFYDSNGNEVAYISDYKLFISNVEITGSYRIGHLIDTVQPDGSVVTKFNGG